MVKGLERGVAIEQVVLLEKTGGRHDWRRDGGVMRVAILTVSTSRAAPAAPTRAATSSSAFARELGGEVAAREVVSDERAEIEERLRDWSDGGACDADPDDRRHRRRAARRDAGGDARGDRAGGARDRRGDARGLARRTRATGCSRARVAGIRGAHADRQLPGQPAQHRPDGGGDRRRAAARARADRGHAPDRARVGSRR